MSSIDWSALKASQLNFGPLVGLRRQRRDLVLAELAQHATELVLLIRKSHGLHTSSLRARGRSARSDPYTLAMATRTPLRRAGRLLLLAVVAFVALTGCIKVDADLQVTEAGTVNGTEIFGFDKQLLTLTGQSVATIQSGLESAVNRADLPAGATIDVQNYEDDTFVGVKVDVKGLPIDQIGQLAGLAANAGNASTFNLVREGDTYRFTASLDYSTTAALPSLPSAASTPAELRVKLHLPGTGAGGQRPDRRQLGDVDAGPRREDRPERAGLGHRRFLHIRRCVGVGE